jgi:hypothetical protein
VGGGNYSTLCGTPQLDNTWMGSRVLTRTLQIKLHALLSCLRSWNSGLPQPPSHPLLADCQPGRACIISNISPATLANYCRQELCGGRIWCQIIECLECLNSTLRPALRRTCLHDGSGKSEAAQPGRLALQRSRPQKRVHPSNHQARELARPFSTVLARRRCPSSADRALLCMFHSNASGMRVRGDW